MDDFRISRTVNNLSENDGGKINKYLVSSPARPCRSSKYVDLCEKHWDNLCAIASPTTPKPNYQEGIGDFIRGWNDLRLQPKNQRQIRESAGVSQQKQKSETSSVPYT